MSTHDGFPHQAERPLDDLLMTDRITSERGQRKRPANIMDNIVLPVFYWLLERRIDIGKIGLPEAPEERGARLRQSTVDSDRSKDVRPLEAKPS